MEGCDDMEGTLLESLFDKKSQSGFIVTIILVFLPVFISCLMVLATMVFNIRNYDLSQSICIKYVMKSQVQLKNKLENLLNLNKQADFLRKMYHQLKKLYRKTLKSGNAIMAATLAVKLGVVQKKRFLLDKRQKYILYQSRKIIQDSLKLFKKEMMKFNAKNIQKDHYQPIPLAVKARQKTMAPSYYPVHSFSIKQRLTFLWSMPLYQFLPQWLKDSFFESGFSNYECSSTLKMEGVNKFVQLTYRKRRNQLFFNWFSQ